MRTISGHDAIVTSSSSLLDRVTVNGWTLIAHQAYAQVFARLAADWAATVHPLRLDPLECWSYAYRPPRMGSGVSDHAGYAIDLNSAHEGAQGVYGGMRTMSRSQLEACQLLTKRYGSVLHWGGSVEWGGQYHQPANWDPMHWYVRPGATAADARDLLDRLGTVEDDMALSDEDVERIAEAVWRRVVKVDGEDKKMGAMAVTCYKAARVQLPSGMADEPA